MHLTIRKQLEYLSPTSFLQSQDCELEFYLTRMAGIKIERMPQNEQMAVGCAFDAFVKSRISELLGKEVFLSKLLESVEPHNASIIQPAHLIFDQYSSFGCVDRLISEGISDIELSYQETIGGKKVPGSKTTLGGVNLFGKPDAELKSVTPLDWKTSGWKSDKPKSPPPGYVQFISKGYNVGFHKDRKTLEEIDKKWATQLVFYFWLRHGLILEEIAGAIDLILISGTLEEPEISVASYRSKISKIFVCDLWRKVSEIWKRFQEGEFTEPMPSHSLCEPFNNPKPCTCFCPLYSRYILDPVHSFIRRK